MVNEFCGFKHGVIGTDKMPADTTLNNMKKADLIKLLHTAQHNYETLMWFYNNAVKANMSQLNNNGWIPCSERMPNKKEYLKNDGRFIVTDGNRSYQSIYDIYRDVFRTFRMYNIGKECIYDQDDCVIAWMPLPPIYQQKEVSHVRL